MNKEFMKVSKVAGGKARCPRNELDSEGHLEGKGYR